MSIITVPLPFRILMGLEYGADARIYQISFILFMAGPLLIGMGLGNLAASFFPGRHWLAGSVIGFVSGILGVMIGVGTFFIVISTPGMPYTTLLMITGPTIGALSPLLWVPLFLKWRAVTR